MAPFFLVSTVSDKAITPCNPPNHSPSKAPFNAGQKANPMTWLAIFQCSIVLLFGAFLLFIIVCLVEDFDR